MKYKVNKKMLPIVVAITLGIGGISSSVYAGISGSTDTTESTESTAETKNIVICHVSSGSKETKHIAYSAWDKYRKEHGNKPGGDYLGSCNNPPSTKTNRISTTKEDTLVINGCTGKKRKALLTLTQSYFDPIIVNDDAWDDETTVLVLSQCLDNGDSSDSTDGKKDKRGQGEGEGIDSVSDSGNHHRISGCKNKDSSESNVSDSSKNYAKKLHDRNNQHNEDKKKKDNKEYGDSSLNISDSSMDDSGVYKEYKKCAGSSGDHYEKTGRGDSGHKYREMSNCSNAKAIKDAVKEHHKKVEDEKRAIVIKKSSLTDKYIKVAVDACTNPPTVIPPSASGGTQGFSGRLNWKEKSQ